MARTATLLVATSLAAGFLVSSAAADTAARQKTVAQRGAEVMPFSLAATIHIFTKTADGGIQQVVTKRDDPQQTRLIRQHLATIAQQFAAGDFAGPEQIHGKAMPGLEVLRAAVDVHAELTHWGHYNLAATRSQDDHICYVKSIGFRIN